MNRPNFRLKAIAAACLFLFGSGIVYPQSERQPRQEKLLNGLKLLMRNDPAATSVVVTVRIHSGSAFDPQGKEGVMSLLTEAFFPTEASRTFFKDDLGGSLDLRVNYDYIQIGASSRPDDFLNMLEAVATAVATPNTEKATVKNLKDLRLAKLKEIDGDPSYVVRMAAAKRLFGKFPYGRPILGTPESIAKIDFADLINAKQRFLTADNATVTITGKFDEALAYRAARRYFGSWLKSDKLIPSTFERPELPDASTESLTSETGSKTFVAYALRGLARNDKDFAASQILATVIAHRLKENTGAEKAATVYAESEGHILPGSFSAGFEAAAGDAPANLLTLLLSKAGTEAEFQTAKAKVASYRAKISADERWLDADTFKLPSEKVEQANFDAVTLADVQRVAERLAKNPVASVTLAPRPPVAEKTQ